MKILILSPTQKLVGGVSNHYLGLASFWKEDVRYITYGRRKGVNALLCLIPDLFYFVYQLIFKDVDVVVVNPSFRLYQLIRDGVYLLLAKLFRKKVVTFIHGWDWSLSDRIQKHPGLFLYVYGKSTFIYVLYSGFRDKLIEIGIDVPIILNTTKVDDNLIANLDISKRNGKIEQILFLARVEISKGIDVTIKTFEVLKEKYPYLKLSVCGTGGALQEYKDYVTQNDISDVTFHGSIEGEAKIREFTNADLYILPTHEEGMATSVLEAMAFGLPIISRPVGGVQDFFINGDMGYLIDSLSPTDYIDSIDLLIKNRDLTLNISNNNFKYASEHFVASKVAKRIEDDIIKYCK